jgi:parallel beta-helix repeat protein
VPGTTSRTASGGPRRGGGAGARGAGIQLGQSRGMAVTGNAVERCGDRGILVYRWEEGRDDTILTGNRVSDIGAQSGGTGQYGNGIQLSKADGVIVADNRIDNCDFSAIRAFSSSNIQVSGNVATRSGETALSTACGRTSPCPGCCRRSASSWSTPFAMTTE